MLRFIDYFLDRITMYRLVLYYLIALVAIAAGLSVFHVLSYDPLAVLGSAFYLTVICWLTSKVFSYVFEMPANIESAYITALILSLIITPVSSMQNIVFLTAVGGLAISSKYILAINGRHIFNPAAIAVLLMAFGPRESASWWVGSSAMLPYVVIGGLLVVRKIRRGAMVISFIIAVFVSTTMVSLFLTHGDLTGSLQKTLFHSSLFFLAFVMLTEPLTSPPTRNKQISYGVLTGLLFPPQIHLGGIYSTPERALSLGNIYSYLISPKIKTVTRLARKVATGPNTGDFIFKLDKPFDFKPGQYMEWTLPHDGADSRGNRRFFTIASSPTENEIRLGVKFYPQGSSFKKALLNLDNTTPVVISQLSGDFTLPEDPAEKLVFIAGGIGITPYRSMVKYLLDSREQRDITLLYSENKPANFVYQDVFDAAEHQIGIKPIYTITETQSAPTDWSGRTGMISADMLKSEVPDYIERAYYISGPHPMVSSMQDMLHGLGVPRHKIKTDFFPGYA